jgi:ferric iron reductase protein FhuF
VSAPAELAPVPVADAIAAAGRAGRDNPLLGIDIGDYSGLPADRLCAAVSGPPPDGPAAAAPGRPDGLAPAAALVDAVGAWAGTRERRVAASLVVLGYAARLVGPTIAVLLRDAILLDAGPAQVRYSYRPEQGFRLALPQPRGWRGRADALRQRWCRDIVDDHLRRLIGAVRAVAPVAPGLLWGNVASGVAGALGTLARDGVALGLCHSTGIALLDHGPLRGSGTMTVHDGQLRFVRRSCCLYYRLDGGGTCGDCPLRRTAG